MMCSKGHRYRGSYCPRCAPPATDYNRSRWQRTRRLVRQRDGNVCQAQGCTTTTGLHVHHREQGAGDGHANLVTLCSRHHAELHRVVA